MHKNQIKAIFVLKLAIFCFCIYVSVSIIQLQMDISRKEKELDEVNARIEAKIEENEIYNHQLKTQNDEDYIEHTAKEKLGYGYPDERVYFDVSGN
ncbi:MAG: septum formation initiator family protein [Oscillospiraceae bacterium]